MKRFITTTNQKVVAFPLISNCRSAFHFFGKSSWATLGKRCGNSLIVCLSRKRKSNKSPNYTIVTRFFKRHTLSTSSFVERILDDAMHSIHELLALFRSKHPSRRTFRLVPEKTETHRHSLPHFLVGPDSVSNELLRYLLPHLDRQHDVLCTYCLMYYFF